MAYRSTQLFSVKTEIGHDHEADESYKIVNTMKS